MTKHEADVIGGLNMTDQISDEAYKQIMIAADDEVDKSAMMYDIYMAGVNMAGEYQGCWVRFKDIEAIVNEYLP